MVDARDENRRRWSWKRVALLLVAVFVLWVGWQVYDIFTGKPDPKVDYASQFHVLSLSVQPGEGENAWELLIETLDHIDAKSNEILWGDPELESQFDGNDIDTYPFLDNINTGPYRPERWVRQLELLQVLDKDDTFDALERIGNMNRCVRPNKPNGMISEWHYSGLMPKALHTLAPLQAARMRLAAHEGEWDQFVQIVNESLAINRFAALQPTPIYRMVAEACNSHTLSEVVASVMEYAPPEETCMAIRDVLAARLPLPPINATIEGGRIDYLDYLQHTFTASGRLPPSAWSDFPDSGKTIDIGSYSLPVGKIAASTVPGHDAAKRITNERFDEALAFSELGVAEILRTELHDHEVQDNLPIHLVVIEEYGPFYVDRVVRNSVRDDFRARTVDVFLAVESFRARHDELPESLDSLVPEFLSAVPIDALSGKAFGYRLVTDDADGRDYLLYSVGVDGVDDGGHEAEGKSWSYPGDGGVDFVINQPRRPMPE